MTEELEDRTTFHQDPETDETVDMDEEGNLIIPDDEEPGSEDPDGDEGIEEAEIEEEVDGKVEKATIRGNKEVVERLKGQRMMQADYTRKTTELARQRDGMADAVRQAVDQARTQYVQQLESLKQAVIGTVEPELRNVDWQALAGDDPERYMRLMARGQQMNATIERLEQQQRQAVETQAREDHSRLTERIRASREAVMAAIPEWSDAHYSDVLSTIAQRYQFTLEEVGQVIDPRIIRLMSDHTKLIKGTAKREIAKKQIAAAPAPVAKGGNRSQSQDQGKTLIAKLRKTGSIHDAAAALAARMNKR